MLSPARNWTLIAGSIVAVTSLAFMIAATPKGSEEPEEFAPIHGKRLVVVFDPRESTALGFDRDIDGRCLTFRRDGTDLVDNQPQSNWDPIKGLALAGPLRGQRLKPLARFVSRVDRWLRFHPKTQIWRIAG